MNNPTKEQIITEMFLCFPSATAMGEEQTALMLAAYLAKLSSFSSEIVSAACERLLREKREFPPSASEVFVACDQRAIELRKRQEWQASGLRKIDFDRYRLPPPQPGLWTLEQLADWTCVVNGKTGRYTLRVDADGKPLKIPDGYPGAGQVVKYGYLTPLEAAGRTRAGRLDARKPYQDAAE